MARVSLIVPTTALSPDFSDRVARSRHGLAEAGHDVEFLVVSDSTGSESDAIGSIRIDETGLARAGVEGLRRASGDLLVLMDPGFDFRPDDVVDFVAHLAETEADLVVASRFKGGKGRPVGRLYGTMMHLLTGTSDPMSGLVGIKRERLDEIVDELRPSGDHLLWEMLTNVDRGGRSEFAIVAPRTVRGRLGLQEFRHLKKLADQRYGNFSRLLQFCAVGASGMIVDLSSYALFQKLLGGGNLARSSVPIVGGTFDLALAAALSITLALTWNFLLNRRLTFSYARGGSIVRQYLTYALSNSLGIALSWSLRLFLPSRVAFFAQHKLAAAVVGIVAATGISFTMARWLVFQKATPSEAESNPGTPNFVEFESTL
ncbi:GtrA family protein [Isosphaeraceae bacterium EP7]